MHLYVPLDEKYFLFKEEVPFRGGEEIIKYDGVTLNAGRGLSPATGIFLAPQVRDNVEPETAIGKWPGAVESNAVIFQASHKVTA
jgi:hypothetical protein